jgi:putative CRISPR-associated protein (TIGR02619 family)
MKTRLICTVGTSLIGNIRRLEETDPIRVAFDNQNWSQVVRSLLEKGNTAQVCGAEINSITSICTSNLLFDRIHILFLVSDTADGQTMGKILQSYYSDRHNPLQFEKAASVVLTGLRDDDVHAFQQQGLKNLVREISQQVRAFGSEAIAINATGGYKAQISFAGMIGQALDIPVYYLFEKFSKVIELPPQPVSLDLTLWLENCNLFEALASAQQLEKSSIEQEYLEKNLLRPMLDEVVIDQVTYVALSAMGYLFYERCQRQFSQQEKIILAQIPEADLSPEQKQIKLRDDHGKDKLQQFSEKLRRSPYVKGIINSLPFNPQTINPIKRVTANGIVDLVLIETDQGLGVCVQTTGRNLAETRAIASHLVSSLL